MKSCDTFEKRLQRLNQINEKKNISNFFKFKQECRQRFINQKKLNIQYMTNFNKNYFCFNGFNEKNNVKNSNRSQYVAFVGNLPDGTVQKDLESIFKNSKHVKIIYDKQNGEFKGHAYVDFGNERELTDGLKYNGMLLADKLLSVSPAKNNDNPDFNDEIMNTYDDKFAHELTNKMANFHKNKKTNISYLDNWCFINQKSDDKSQTFPFSSNNSFISDNRDADSFSKYKNPLKPKYKMDKSIIDWAKESYSHPLYPPIRNFYKNNSKNTMNKPPDKPQMPYFRYSRKVWDDVKRRNEKLKMWDIGRLVGNMWRNLSDNEKQPYIMEYENDKLKYQEQMRKFYNQNKSKHQIKSKYDMDLEEKLIKNESRYFIQPIENVAEGDEECSIKHISAKRYYRNNELVYSIFSSAKVPDTKTVVTAEKLDSLKRNVASLEGHQSKILSELEIKKEEHECRKKKIKEEEIQFNLELKNLTEINVKELQSDHESILKSVDEITKHTQAALTACNEYLSKTVNKPINSVIQNE
ncbi:hypothetical protein A3Q56_06825 [Intoshia linei]|uniref:HMG box domain-containing protein n=1 Tax=Intoshia linei TaxID=1819745 RepID=A0A177ATW5_9BILA|nr:hypothetical protein A3Q56_06825 [Intoshia linei]